MFSGLSLYLWYNFKNDIIPSPATQPLSEYGNIFCPFVNTTFALVFSLITKSPPSARWIISTPVPVSRSHPGRVRPEPLPAHKPPADSSAPSPAYCGPDTSHSYYLGYGASQNHGQTSPAIHDLLTYKVGIVVRYCLQWVVVWSQKLIDALERQYFFAHVFSSRSFSVNFWI